jgi:hypothetical protein
MVKLPKGAEEIHRDLSLYNGRDMKQAPPKYDSEMLPIYQSAQEATVTN